MTEPLYSEILPRLFQSGTDDYDTLGYAKCHSEYRARGPFDSVVCLYGAANPSGHEVREQRFAFYDAELDERHIPEILDLSEWLHAGWKSGKVVASKCQAGWNRSGLVMALVLMLEGYSASDAIDLIRERRSPHALSNGWFVDFLYLYEAEQKMLQKS